MASNAAWAATKYILVEVVLDILYFPVWWYTAGFIKLLRMCGERLVDTARNLSLGIWLRNMFTPMFGQYDWQGRMISFMMRVFMLIFKLIVFFIWMILLFVLIVVWLAGPAVIVWYLLFQVANVPLPFRVR